MLSRSRAGLAAFLAALLAPAAAAAAEDKEITGDLTLSGDAVFNTFTVTATGTLHVAHYDGASASTGRLRIQANTIHILQGGKIEADGAGHLGADGADGTAPMGTAGGGNKGATPGLPGGGGGFFGLGGQGSSEDTPGTCVLYAGSKGGQPFFDMKTPSLGAAGGAANVSPTTATAGGAGGGVIILEAAVIQIDGMITASGATRSPIGGVAPGGGSGGTVKILSALVQGSGTIEARGGDGAHGTGSTNPVNPIKANNGGGGSGGAIIFSLPAGVMPPATLALVTTGGASGDCAEKGADGGVAFDPIPTPCVDLDNDNHYSAQCPGGDDCDDTDPEIQPGAAEVCDGKDNDCNGTKDDGANLCAPGTACMAGSCQAVHDAGSGADAGDEDAGAPPDHYEFGGGCALPSGGGLGETAAGAAAFALGALALAASRRPRRSRRRAR